MNRIIPQIIKQNILKKIEVQVMPIVASSILSAIQNENVSIEKIEKLISLDQALVARLINVVNSPFYGLSQKITSISTAIMILGLKDLKNLVLTLSSRDIYQSPTENQILLWEHHIATSIFARIISQLATSTISDEAFLGSFLHDIAKVVILNHFERIYDNLIAVANLDQQEFYQTENALLGYNHAELSAMILTNWNFDPKIITAVRYHHEMNKITPIEEETLKLAAVINLADHLARYYGIGYKKPGKTITFTELDAVEVLELSMGTLHFLRDTAIKVYEAEHQNFN